MAVVMDLHRIDAAARPLRSERRARLAWAMAYFVAGLALGAVLL